MSDALGIHKDNVASRSHAYLLVIEELSEVDFFQEMVEYAIQTHDLEAA
jgi:hypothetical protein